MYLFSLSSSNSISLTSKTQLPSTLYYITISKTAGNTGSFTVIGASYSGYIYFSPNSAASFSQFSGTPAASWKSIASSNNGQYVTAASASAVYYSSSYGVSFTITSLVSNYQFSGLALSSTGQKQVYAASGFKMYFSSDYGVTWVTSGFI